MTLPPIPYRQRLEVAAKLLEDGVLVVLAQPAALRNATVEHPYRQESFLHYLTGFEEPEAALVVCPYRNDGDRYHVFLREKDPERELWEGRRLGVALAKTALHVDQAHEFGDFWKKLPELMNGAARAYLPLGLAEAVDRALLAAVTTHKQVYGRKGVAARLPIYDAGYLAGRLRLRKGPEELERMKAAAGVTRKTFETIYKTLRPGMNEREIHGLILGEFLRHGAEMEAYGSIVAGGANACILHYRDNNMVLKDGDLVLIDAGSQYQYYASDVTRTFPVGKRFAPGQKDLYEIVLGAQKAAIGAVRVGGTLKEIHDVAVAQLVDGLVGLKLLKGGREELIANGTFRKYYPHGTSHWIGMDVHDVGVYQELGAQVPLEAGMYFSVEPGIYIDPADQDAPPGLRGMGIRIEDDVLVTATGPEVYTQGIPKEVRELENRF